MKHKVYIQALNNFPIADWAVSAYMGFKEKQVDIIFFEDIDEVPVSPYNIVVAFIEDTNKYFEKLGLPSKMCLNIPWQLNNSKYTGRRVNSTSCLKGWIGWSDFEDYPIFIKPNRKAKEFVARVVRNRESAEIYFKDILLNTPALLSSVVDFVSEYRCYIINREIKGIYHYLGDIFTFPDVNIIKEMVKVYTESPEGYSLDVGITKDGRTLLVECNDGWSLGNYGLNHTTYSTLLGVRWRELMESLKKV